MSTRKFYVGYPPHFLETKAGSNTQTSMPLYPTQQQSCNTGSLAGMFNNRSKIRLPGATYIPEQMDRKHRHNFG
ncbi:hypothetical protein B9Z55_023189 [Caenorhabditis nigoni]|uniref:Uncharacterized protein n=1 Tax=Caenorhabditis nigoni TaxID=1611254 RepID=A0A2G5SNE8_9PELO|nr:hypothetical protein B9Z55_023189 [Caenorhabditis nigoni]